MSEINISVESSVSGSLAIAGVSGNESDVQVVDGTTVDLTVLNGVGAPGANDITLAAGTNIQLQTNGSTTTISAQTNLSDKTLGDISDVDLSSPVSGQLLQYNGTQWVAISPTAANTLIVSNSEPAELGTGGSGTSVEAARADHVHDMPTFQEITSGTATTNSSLKLDPGTGVVEIQGGSSGSGRLVLNCSSNTHGVSIQSPPHSAAASYTLTLPDAPGTQGQVLTTSGPSGQLSWSNGIGSVGGGVSWTTPAPTSSATTGAPGAIAYDNNYIYVMTLQGWKRAALAGWGSTLAISSQPTNVSVSSGQMATFLVAASGPGAVINYQWQTTHRLTTPFADIAGATSSSYAIQGTENNNGYYYRVVVSSPQSATPIESDTVQLIVAATNRLLLESGDGLDAENSDNIIHDGLGSTLYWSTQPANKTLAVGATPTHTFSAVASDSSGAYISYSWQMQPYSAHAWTTLAGETSSTLTLTNLTVARNQRRYRCVASASGAPDIISNEVYVTVQAAVVAPIELDPQAPADVVISSEFTPERSVEITAPGAYALELQKLDGVTTGNWETIATDQPNRFSYNGEVGSVAEGTRHGTSTNNIEQNEFEPSIESGGDDPFALGMACDENLLKMVGFDGIDLEYYSRPTINDGWSSTQTISGVSTNACMDDDLTMTFSDQGEGENYFRRKFALHKSAYGMYGLDSASRHARYYANPANNDLASIQRHNHLVQMSGDGETIAVSTAAQVAESVSRHEFVLRVKVYKLVSGSWQHFQTINGKQNEITEAAGGSNESLTECFGKSIAINHDGSVIAIGSPYAKYGSGTVEIYQKETASPFEYKLITELSEGNQYLWGDSSSYTNAIYYFDPTIGHKLKKLGMHLSLSGDGLRLACACPGPNLAAQGYSNGSGFINSDSTYAHVEVLKRDSTLDNEWSRIQFQFNETYAVGDGSYESRSQIAPVCSAIKEQLKMDELKSTRSRSDQESNYQRREGFNHSSLRVGGFLSKDGNTFVGDFDENIVVYEFNGGTNMFQQIESLYSNTEDPEPRRWANYVRQRSISMSADGSVIAVGNPVFFKVELKITENRMPIGLLSYYRRSFDESGRPKYVQAYEKTWVATDTYRSLTYPNPAPTISREYFKGQGYGVAMHKDGTQLLSLRNSAWTYRQPTYGSSSGYVLFYLGATTPYGGTETATYNTYRYGAIETGTLGGGLKDSDGQKYRYLITAPEASNSPHASDEFEVDVIPSGTISIQNELTYQDTEFEHVTLDLGTVTASNGQACSFNWFYQPATSNRFYSVRNNATKFGNIGINLEGLGGQALRFESNREPPSMGLSNAEDNFNYAKLDLGSNINRNQWDGSTWYCIVSAPGCPSVRTNYAKIYWLYFKSVLPSGTGSGSQVANQTRAEYYTNLGFRLDSASTGSVFLFCGRNVTASFGLQHKTYLNPIWRDGSLPFRQTGEQRYVAYFTLNFADGTTKEKVEIGQGYTQQGYSSNNTVY